MIASAINSLQDAVRAPGMTACAHERSALVKIECGAGGIQFRKFCTRCWCSLSSAIPHLAAHAEEARSGIEAPLADLETIHAAQSCYRRRERSGEGSL